MNSCEKCNLYFDKALYNELNSDEEKYFNDHLNSCDVCAKEYNELKSTLTLISENHERVEPGDIFQTNFWNNLAPKLEKRPSFIDTIITSFNEWFAANRSLTYQLAGGTALIVIGIFLGRTFFSNDLQVNPTHGELSQQQLAIQASAERYIDRSKVLLLGMMNFDPETDDIESINLEQQQNISRELLAQASELKSDLNKPSTQQLKRLINDLEVILMQIANLETEFDLAGIDLIQSGIDRKGIFLKINIQRMSRANSNINPASGNQVKNEKNSI